MRNLLISAALISAVAVSAPAAAQYQNGRGDFGYNQRGGQGIERQVQQLHQRIDNMYQRRLLSNNEARRLHSDGQKISRRNLDYARNGLSQREHHDLMSRIENLRQRLQRERFEGRDQRRDDRRDDRRGGW